MCEFKIIKKNDGSQIGEDIVIVSYSEDNELLFKDILGVGLTLESALVLDVNTLNQTLTILEHPIIKDFINLMNNLTGNKDKIQEIENFQAKLEDLK